MKDSIRSVLGENITAIYLFGSVAMNDFKPGWSDIDLLCLTAETITDEQARKLVNLRQTLSFYEKQPIYFQYFEGAIVAWPAFKSRSCTKVVYWGTGKQRIDHIYSLDPFSEYSLIQNGILPYGADIRAELCLPSYTALDRLSYIIMIQYGTMRLTQAAAFMPADGFWISHGVSIRCAPEASLQKNQSGRMGAGTASVPGGTRSENSATTRCVIKTIRVYTNGRRWVLQYSGSQMFSKLRFNKQRNPSIMRWAIKSITDKPASQRIHFGWPVCPFDLS